MGVMGASANSNKSEGKRSCGRLSLRDYMFFNYIVNMYHESFARVWVVSITTLLEELDIRSIARVNSKLLLRFLDFKVRRWILILRLLQHCHLVM